MTMGQMIVLRMLLAVSAFPAFSAQPEEAVCHATSTCDAASDNLAEPADVVTMLQRESQGQKSVQEEVGTITRGMRTEHGSRVGVGAGRRLTRRQTARLKGKGAEQLEEYKAENLAYESRLSDAEQSAIAVKVTPTAFGGELKGFVNHQVTRYFKDDGNVESGEYLKKGLSDLGYEVQMQGGEQGGNFGTEGNVVAFKRGSKEPTKWVLVGAHYDSVNWESTADTAPGAEDNGSGVAALLQTAKALKDVPTDLSVAFVGFNGEEEGTLGSKSFVEELKRKDGTFSKFGALQAALIMDEVAYPSKEQGHGNQVILETSGKEKIANRALVDTVAKGLSAEPNLKNGPGVGPWVNYHGFGSDHMSFLEAGYPALLLIERDNMYYADKYGHSSRDTLERTDSSFGAAMTRLALRGVLSLANPTGKQV